MNKVYVALRVRPEKLYELLQGSLPYRTFVRGCDIASPFVVDKIYL